MPRILKLYVTVKLAYEIKYSGTRTGENITNSPVTERCGTEHPVQGFQTSKTERCHLQ